MSNLTRWEPVRETMTLREAMDRLFNDAFTRPVSLSGVSTLAAIDLYETSDELVVQAALPGLKADDVQISITGEMLTLRGEFKPDNGKKEVTYQIRERGFGAFERTIGLPVEVQADKAKADFENGILTITLPKAEAHKPKIINIKAK
jgi:HSP20 family protein